MAPPPELTSAELVHVAPHQEALLAVAQVPRVEDVAMDNLLATVLEAARQHHGRHVLFDLGRVEMLPSSSLGALVRLHHDLRTRGQRLVLVGLQPMVRSALAVTRLDRLFELCENLPEGLGRIRRA